MPETQTYGFEYETPQTKPGITLTGNSDGSSPILAEQVDQVLANIDARVTANEGAVGALQTAAPTDTGWTSLSVTAAAGYDVDSALYRHWGPIVSIHIDLIRTGGDFIANSQGNVTDTTLCTINTPDARPSQHMISVLQARVTSGTVSNNTNGSIVIADMHSNSIITTDDIVRLRTTYFVSTFS